MEYIEDVHYRRHVLDYCFCSNREYNATHCIMPHGRISYASCIFITWQLLLPIDCDSFGTALEAFLRLKQKGDQLDVGPFLFQLY